MAPPRPFRGRDDPAPSVLDAGAGKERVFIDRAELADEARRAMATLDARALAAALITAAPLAVAWLEGLR